MKNREANGSLSSRFDAKASPSAVARLLQQVKAIESRSIVSSNPEKYSIFRVDTAGTEIRLWEQKNIAADFILGKMAPSYYRSYVRQAQSHDVVETDGIPNYIFERPVRDWREKTIVTARPCEYQERCVSIRRYELYSGLAGQPVDCGK